MAKTQPRKTFEVGKLIDKANRVLYLPDDDRINADYRRGVIGVLESVLVSTGHYDGFTYQNSEFDRPENRGLGGSAHLKREGERDDTRRFYYGGSVDMYRREAARAYDELALAARA